MSGAGGGSDRDKPHVDPARPDPADGDRTTDPHRRDDNPAVSPDAKREISTPGEGAGPLPTSGDEVDPGAG